MTDLRAEAKVDISADVIKALSNAATTALPYETGGLLIGWRDGENVVVRAWIQLGTPNPRTNRFDIDAKKATKVLKHHLRMTSNPLEGYVGAWHTHPALAPPSGTDIETFGASAAATSAPLAFVVLATDGFASTAHIAWAGRSGDRVMIRTQKTITVERTKSE
ncbi:Mov34/MPN/PAD-1 family protein [Cryobacterium sp. Y57]|uniref:Mov34/MPN/PAD-1 family protein n=1 Tax=Cryobacterium sp. Y57 TaxID=2048287 RepID=UPI000CE2DC8B|nr:Mov34/MPN/PAD-1 family protein [Cryobacterium sp. Y57]